MNYILGDRQQLRQILARNVSDSKKVDNFDLIIV